MSQPSRDWDDAYANMAHIPDGEAYPARWAAEAAAYRESEVRIETGLAYGTHPRARFDLIWPEDRPKGLAVFVHGGYWLKFDSSYWTHLSEGPRARGWVVAQVQYPVAPEARIAEITQAVGAAITEVAGRVDGPIRLAGHSAGGHLVSRMICTDSPISEGIRARIGPVLSISGVHDLRPLMWTQMNADLRLDEREAFAESPVLQRPLEGHALTAWVGGDERPEFIRQSELLALIWGGLGAETRCIVEPGTNHFTVVEALADPDSALTDAFIGAR